MKACFVISIGKYGGFYWHKGASLRLCLGWVAFTFLPVDGDVMLDMAMKWAQWAQSQEKPE